jgi:hypothetical protein
MGACASIARDPAKSPREDGVNHDPNPMNQDSHPRQTKYLGQHSEDDVEQDRRIAGAKRGKNNPGHTFECYAPASSPSTV